MSIKRAARNDRGYKRNSSMERNLEIVQEVKKRIQLKRRHLVPLIFAPNWYKTVQYTGVKRQPPDILCPSFFFVKLHHQKHIGDLRFPTKATSAATMKTAS